METEFSGVKEPPKVTGLRRDRAPLGPLHQAGFISWPFLACPAHSNLPSPLSSRPPAWCAVAGLFLHTWVCAEGWTEAPEQGTGPALKARAGGEAVFASAGLGSTGWGETPHTWATLPGVLEPVAQEGSARFAFCNLSLMLARPCTHLWKLF